MRRLILIAAVSLAAFPCHADDTDKVIEADTQRMIISIKANDAGPTIDMLYTPFVDSFGKPREVLKKAIQHAMDNMAANGFRVVSCNCIPPYRRISTPVNDYVVVPTHTVFWIGMHEMDDTDYILAIKKHGDTKWEYLGASRMTPEIKSRLFPDLKGSDLPVTTSKVLF